MWDPVAQGGAWRGRWPHVSGCLSGEVAADDGRDRLAVVVAWRLHETRQVCLIIQLLGEQSRAGVTVKEAHNFYPVPIRRNRSRIHIRRRKAYPYTTRVDDESIRFDK